MSDRRAEIVAAYRLSGYRPPEGLVVDERPRPADQRERGDSSAVVEHLVQPDLTAVSEVEPPGVTEEPIVGEIVEDGPRPSRPPLPAHLLEPSAPMERARQCTAMSKRSGQRCRKAPIRGHRVCRMHGGGIPAVRRKAEWNLMLESIMLPDEGRPVWEVLLSAVAGADQLMRRAAAQADDDATIEQLKGLAEAVERASKLATAAVNARAHEAVAQRASAQADQMARVLNAALDALRLSIEQEDVARAAMRAELEAMDREA